MSKTTIKKETLKRKTKTETVSLSTWEISSTLEGLRNMVNDWIAQYGENANFVVLDSYDGCDVQITYQRLETDEEYKARLEAAQKAAERRRIKAEQEAIKQADAAKEAEKEERRLYQELKKKFEK